MASSSSPKAQHLHVPSTVPRASWASPHTCSPSDALTIIPIVEAGKPRLRGCLTRDLQVSTHSTPRS